MKKTTRFGDVLFIHKHAKSVGWDVLDFFRTEIIMNHFIRHNGTYDEFGKASCQMTEEQIQLCLDDYISEMTLPAKFLFRILTA